MTREFENLVSYERCKAEYKGEAEQLGFENLVSYERCKAFFCAGVNES